jgi:hypothetical protein
MSAHFDLRNYTKFNDTICRFEAFTKTPTVLENQNNKIRMLANGASTTTTIISSGINDARAITFDTVGNLIFCDFGNNLVKSRIDGVVYTIAGGGSKFLLDSNRTC